MKPRRALRAMIRSLHRGRLGRQQRPQPGDFLVELLAQQSLLLRPLAFLLGRRLNGALRLFAQKSILFRPALGLLARLLGLLRSALGLFGGSFGLLACLLGLLCGTLGLFGGTSGLLG